MQIGQSLSPRLLDISLTWAQSNPAHTLGLAAPAAPPAPPRPSSATRRSVAWFRLLLKRSELSMSAKRASMSRRESVISFSIFLFASPSWSA